jgi:hypothetical protein
MGNVFLMTVAKEAPRFSALPVKLASARQNCVHCRNPLGRFEVLVAVKSPIAN